MTVTSVSIKLQRRFSTPRPARQK